MLGTGQADDLLFHDVVQIEDSLGLGQVVFGICRSDFGKSDPQTPLCLTGEPQGAGYSAVMASNWGNASTAARCPRASAMVVQMLLSRRHVRIRRAVGVGMSA